MSAEKSVVVVFSELYRQKPVAATAAREAGSVCDFESGKKRIVGLRKQLLYATQYVESFLELEEECARLVHCAKTWGVCNYFPCLVAANKFLTFGELVQTVAKKFELGTLPCIQTTQTKGEELREAVHGFSMENAHKKDAYAEALNIQRFCQELRAALSPLLSVVVEARSPAHT